MNDAQRSSGSEQPNRGPDSERLLALLKNARAGTFDLDLAVTEWLDPSVDADAIRISIASYQHADWGAYRSYTRILDCALRLVPEGWSVRMQSTNIEGDMVHEAAVDYRGWHGAPTLPLAVCIAALSINATASKSVPSLSPTPDRGASSPESLPESNNQSETP